MEKYGVTGGPIVIGGVGGSGTRVVAEMLSLFGIYIGSDLNDAHDNLLYTLLFKRPHWYYENCQNDCSINTGLSLFSKMMTQSESPSMREVAFLTRAVCEMALTGHNQHGNGCGVWPLMRIPRILLPWKARVPASRGWGWKEPNSHLLIKRMDRFFGNFRYIHTIRHGLDMAFSKNQQQLFNWGPLFGIERPRSEVDVPRAAFRYWVRANEAAIEAGETIGSEKFLVMNFDELCRSPESGLKRLLAFLQIDIDRETIQRAVSLPQIPKSMGRFKSHDLDQFESADLDALSRLGFSVN